MVLLGCPPARAMPHANTRLRYKLLSRPLGDLLPPKPRSTAYAWYRLFDHCQYPFLRHSSARTAGCAETAPMRRIAHPPWPRSAAKEPWKRPLGGSHSWVTSRGASRPSTRPLGGSLHLLGRAWLPKQDADTTPGCAPPQDADTAPGRAPTQDTDTAHREDPHEGSLAVHRQALLLHFVPPANYIGLPPHLVSWCSLANS